ncbi:MerR family transcriptional regulator OS=Lysinibacillus sphaericus OX=1421 GN=LS41612_17265 PE=4 SV=1 [Lysinibacillus sphaericus]
MTFTTHLTAETIAAEEPDLTDTELRRIMREEMRQAQRMQKSSIRRGDLSRFY